MHPNVTIARVNTSQACAACKYQRRKCAPDCILAPYFPHDRQRQFLNAHKLFGVSNITKIIRNLDQPEKDVAMRSIIFQSDVRANDPVGGCYSIIRRLQRQIEYTKAELDIVLPQLAFCRAQVQAQAQAQAQAHQQQIVLVPEDDATDSTLNCDIFNADALNSYGQLQMNYHLEQCHINQDDNNDVVLQEESASSWGVQGCKQHCSNESNFNFKPIFDGVSDEPHDFRFESEEMVEQSDEVATDKDDQPARK